ncbi:cell growth regulator with EF hand domain protein 1 [Pogona vitticeps]
MRRSLFAAAALLLLLLLLLRAPAGWAAPKDGGPAGRPERPQDAGGRPAFSLNPLHPGKESLRMLQEYLKSVRPADEEASALTRDQALLFLFALHDDDQSGRLDGLELMQLLRGLGSWQAEGKPSPDSVVQMVDSILAAQDINGDGVLEPSEMLLGPQQGQPPASPRAPNREEGGPAPWAPEATPHHHKGAAGLPERQEGLPSITTTTSGAAPEQGTKEGPAPQ